MKFELINTSQINPIKIALKCPHCGHNGTFEPTAASIHDIKVPGGGAAGYILGIRRCPNAKCYGHLFFIASDNPNAKYPIITIYPSQTIPFEKENIPAYVLKAFEEAIICASANCYIASGIMIRKTLEEVCKDRGAQGKNLFKRLEELGTKILVPKELLEGMQELRLLGNDAAHIEAETFSQIGKEEIEISIEFTKEILKAVYQYEHLLERLRSLKK